MAVSRHFTFLEFSDPEVLSLLTELRDTLYGLPQRDPVHITVRGPYKEVPSPQSLENHARVLEGNFVMLKDAGMFKTGKGYAVFLNAYSKIFDQIWWKPDFRDERKRPHLTLFESGDLRDATEVLRFLETEGVEIVTYALSLTVYTSKQRTLSLDHQVPFPNVTPTSKGRVLIKPGIINRALQLKKFLSDPNGTGSFQLALV